MFESTASTHLVTWFWQLGMHVPTEHAVVRNADFTANAISLMY